MPIACANVHESIGEYQRAYIYKLFMETVPNSVASAFPNALTFSKEIDIYNIDAVFPDRITNAITIRWSGEFFDIPGVDNSTRAVDFSFFDDEAQWAYDFFCTLKDMTGNEYNQAGVWGIQGKFNMGVAKVSVDKETITSYRRLVGCRVYGVSNESFEKGSETYNKLKINIHWDRNQEDKAKRGMTI